MSISGAEDLPDQDLPSPRELQLAWTAVKKEHRLNLAHHGVEIPLCEHYADQANALFLAVLYHWKDVKEGVHKNTITQVVKRDMPHLGPDQQIRHLRLQCGWDLDMANYPQGVYRLRTDKPDQEFLMRQHRQSTIPGSDFDSMKKDWGFRCATCGDTEGKSWRRPGQKVRLQQGHCDPHEDLSLENMLPQCKYCNQQAYRDHFTFERITGRVHAVASTEPIKRARRTVQWEIFWTLWDELSGEVPSPTVWRQLRDSAYEQARHTRRTGSRLRFWSLLGRWRVPRRG